MSVLYLDLLLVYSQNALGKQGFSASAQTQNNRDSSLTPIKGETETVMF